MKVYPYSMPHTKIKSKWIKGFNVTHYTVELREKYHREKLLDIVLDNDFFSVTSKTLATKTKLK